MIIPIGHESDEVRRLPWVTFFIIGLCIVIHIFVSMEMKQATKKAERYLQEVERYYFTHPYLKLDPELEKYFYRSDTDRDVLPEIYGLRKKVPEEEVIEEQQEELDEIVQNFKEVVRNIPFIKWGFIPAKKSFITLITHMFLHGGWLHLIGNLLFLYLYAPFVEDLWGRPVFLSFYIMAGIFAALLYSFHYPDLEGPLIGASGAISGAMGAFLIRFWKTKIKFFYMFSVIVRGTFEAPAWVMLPGWFLMEIFNAKMMDSANTQGGGVGHWAHIWGFVFGVVTAIVIIKTKIEEKFMAPKIESKTSFVDENYQMYEDALQLRDNGNKTEAYNKLLDVSRKDQSHPEIGEALWILGLEMGKQNEAKPYFIKTIETQIKRNQMDYALGNFRQLREMIPGASISIPSKMALIDQIIKTEEYKEAEDLYNEILKEVSLNSLPRLILDLCATASVLDLKRDTSLSQHIVGLAIQHPEIPQEKKEELKTLLFAIPKEREELKSRENVGAVEFASVSMDQDQAKAAPPLEEKRKLMVSQVTPLAIKGTTFALEIKNMEKKSMPLNKVKSMSVVKISPPSEKPFLLFDLFLDDPSIQGSKIRTVRFFSNAFTPRKFVPQTQSHLEDFRTFISLLLQLSGATPYPDMGSVLLKRVKNFTSVKDYEDSLLQ